MNIQYIHKHMQKIGFCFLIYDTINNEDVWNHFFTNIDTSKYGIYIHYKHDNRLKYFENCKLRKEECIETKYADVSLIHAHNILFKKALEDGCFKIISLSQACIPFKPFDYIYDFLTKDNCGHFNVAEQGYCFPRCDSLLKYYDRNFIQKSSNWFILNKRICEIVTSVDNSKINLEYDGIDSPEEHFFITQVYANHLEGEIITTPNLSNDATTFTNWSDTEYKYASINGLKNYDFISDEEIQYLLNSKCLFGRKFNSNCKNLTSLTYLTRINNNSSAISAIQDTSLNTSAEYLWIIYSCQKNLEKAKRVVERYFFPELTCALNIKILIMYGDTNINSEWEIKDDNFLVLKISDDYESLYEKTLKLFKSVSFLFPNCKGCFKCDDDVIINIKTISNFIDFVKHFNINYAGVSCAVSENRNNVSYIQSKKGNGKNISIHTPIALYCGGPLYYLSLHSVNLISQTNTSDVSHIFYEDLIVGHVLNNHSIYPIQYPLYSDNLNEINKKASCFHNREHKNTLFLKICGGIGNQMFQIASGYSVAVKNNMNFIIVNSSIHRNKFTHTANNNYFINTLFNHFPSINSEHILLNMKHYKDADENCFVHQNLKFNEDVYLDGYFQNEKYFMHHANEIVHMFTLNIVYNNFMINIQQNRELCQILEKSYFIHVRRGDYINNAFHKIDYDSYYKKAIQHILQKDPSAYFFILSDDIEYCKTYSLFHTIQKSFIELEPLESLYFMSICKKGGICCNSTFSWWGSYLNTNPNKLVIFPKKWVNANWANDIYYKGSVVLN